MINQEFFPVYPMQQGGMFMPDIPDVEVVQGTYRNINPQLYNQRVNLNPFLKAGVTPSKDGKKNVMQEIQFNKAGNRVISEKVNIDEDFANTYMNYQQYGVEGSSLPVNWFDVDAQKTFQASTTAVEVQGDQMDLDEAITDFSQWSNFDKKIFPNKSKGATRRLPVAQDLYNIIGTVANKHGFTIGLGSGGQDNTTGRVGSRRHDHGHAGDLDVFYKGKRLRTDRKKDIQMLKPFITDLYRAGATGIGAAPGYMGGSRIHVDNAAKYGQGASPYWGSKGKSANAPEWLIDAYNESKR